MSAGGPYCEDGGFNPLTGGSATAIAAKASKLKYTWNKRYIKKKNFLIYQIVLIFFFNSA